MNVIALSHLHGGHGGTPRRTDTAMKPLQQIESVNPGVAGIEKETAVVLRAEDIRAGYGKKEVLHGVTLEVRRGEIVALVGANGAGKSTLLKVVAGLLKPTAGRIWFDGQDVTCLPAYRRSQMGVGYLLQGGEVFPSLTVQENLGIAGGNGVQDLDAIDPVLRLFPPLRTKFRQRAGLLSGGERQMLALAMVLVRKPRLLLLDEPTAGLAPSIAAQTLRKVGDYCQLQQMAVVLVEQRLREALYVAHRALALILGQPGMQTTEAQHWANCVDLHLGLFPSPDARQRGPNPE
jgi:ABC-type branched-subunit amino acid transport system ATPase component